MRKKAAGLAFVEFMLPTLVETPPAGGEWIHEVKYDGYRTQIILQGGRAQAFTRRGNDWTAKYAPVVAAAEQLPVDSAILDGEMVVLNDQHISDYAAFRRAIKSDPGRLVFVAFDLLHLDGQDLRSRTLLERRSRLEHLVRNAGPVIQFSQHVAGGGSGFYEAADQLGLEGMVSKRADSRYVSGRTESWLKTKCYEESTYEVAAVLREPGRPAVAYMVDENRRYVGGAFITLPHAIRERLWARVQAGAKPVKGVVTKPGAQWLKPGTIAKVRHLKGEEKLRHATVRELVQ